MFSNRNCHRIEEKTSKATTFTRQGGVPPFSNGKSVNNMRCKSKKFENRAEKHVGVNILRGWGWPQESTRHPFKNAVLQTPPVKHFSNHLITLWKSLKSIIKPSVTLLKVPAFKWLEKSRIFRVGKLFNEVRKKMQFSIFRASKAVMHCIFEIVGRKKTSSSINGEEEMIIWAFKTRLRWRWH